MCLNLWNKDLSKQKTHTLHLGIMDDKKRTKYWSLFLKANSYTGENTIRYPAVPNIQQQIIQLLLRTGCRMADPGEFTLRAFLTANLIYRRLKRLRI
jgi:tRNA modification GTPase